VKRFALVAVLLVFFVSLGFSMDFGLATDQKAEMEKDHFLYTPSFIPWLSWNGGKGVSVYLSALLSLTYNNYSEGDLSGWDEPVLLPELGRFAVTYRNPRFSIEAGRVLYSDALGFTAGGLFDGARVEAALSAGTLSAGVFYTGLLYKGTAEVLMTETDVIEHAEPWDWDAFDRYFASRRVFGALRWDMPLFEYQSLSFEGVFQFDVNGNEQSLNSQYAEILVDFFFENSMRLSAGVLFEAMEAEEEFAAALGFLARLGMDMPGSLNDSLSLTLKFTSGAWNDTFAAFTPISSFSQGMIFTGTLGGGLGMVSVDYSARLLQSLLAEATLRYFAMTYEDPAVDGNLYGGEFWASLAWQPVEDIRLSLGGGIFFPSLGNVYPSDTDPMWKARAVLSMSF